jgi:hypothetical protein
MPNFNNQSIVISLDGTTKASGSFAPQIAVPCHIHKHSELIGLGSDDHPIYLTVQRGTDLFNSLIAPLLPSDTPVVNAEGLGGGLDIFKTKEGEILQFRTLVGGEGVELSLQNDELVIDIDPDVLISGTDGGTYP